MSIGLTLAAGTAFAAGTGTTLATRSVLTSAGVIAAAITFATGAAFAARTVLTSASVITAAIAVATGARAAFATSGAAGTGTTFAAGTILTSTGIIAAAITLAAGTGAALATARVAVMPAMLFKGRTVRGGQGGEFRCVEHAVAVLVILGEQIGGGIGLVVALSFRRALRMGGGGQREAAEEDRECFVHVTCGLGVYGVWGVTIAFAG
jgi:hypothetical protein